MKLLERNGDRVRPWAFESPIYKIGLRALLWPDWKQYSVLPWGRTDSRLSQVKLTSALPEKAIQKSTKLSQLRTGNMERKK
jgi:hypothetical protein